MRTVEAALMRRAYLRAASSAAASVAIATLALVVVSPIIGANADPVDPCDPALGQDCDPVVTVTVTQTPTPTSDPVVTKTVTVTPTPSRTASPHASASKTPSKAVENPPADTSGTNGANNTNNQPTQTLPTTQATVPNVDLSPGGTTPDADGGVSLAPVDPTPAPAGPSPTPSFEEPDPGSAPIEIRSAAEFDKAGLSQKLAIPAALFVGIALLAWFILEGRLRRMAHAAAVGRAGPRSAPAAPGAVPGAPGTPEAVPAGYPAPGYGHMVGLMPVQPYAVGYPPQPYGYPAAPYGYPVAYGQPGYPMMDPSQMHVQMPQAQMPGVPPAEAAPQGGDAGPDVWGPAVGEPQPGAWSEAAAPQPPASDRTLPYPLPGDPPATGQS
ncbi:hypothetical protein JOL79_25275 [Microbispora sp. RL4-1S]|uniref:Uncharacterized protein n=1 Tax=Microbispora oryzae TaxID=2806554 RepID=A0A940WNI8_9ACTN|nr:hypothetical protein [Microbispora oryzae]MBP2707102.1 hypothetical protein [Microbispora oryzae]